MQLFLFQGRNFSPRESEPRTHRGLPKGTSSSPRTCYALGARSCSEGSDAHSPGGLGGVTRSAPQGLRSPTAGAASPGARGASVGPRAALPPRAWVAPRRRDWAPPRRARPGQSPAPGRLRGGAWAPAAPRAHWPCQAHPGVRSPHPTPTPVPETHASLQSDIKGVSIRLPLLRTVLFALSVHKLFVFVVYSKTSFWSKFGVKKKLQSQDRGPWSPQSVPPDIHSPPRVCVLHVHTVRLSKL